MLIMPQIQLSGLGGDRTKFLGMQKGTRFGITARLTQLHMTQGFLILMGPCQDAKETGVIDNICHLFYK